jgi:hypothetical protein
MYVQYTQGLCQPRLSIADHAPSLGYLEVEVNLLPMVSWPVCLGVGLPSGAHDQLFVFSLTVAGLLIRGTLSDVRMGL